MGWWIYLSGVLIATAVLLIRYYRIWSDNIDITVGDIVLYILGGLGSDFKPISTVLQVRPKQYTLDEIQYHLLSFEAQLEEENVALNYEVTH